MIVGARYGTGNLTVTNMYSGAIFPTTDGEKTERSAVPETLPYQRVIMELDPVISRSGPVTRYYQHNRA